MGVVVADPCCGVVALVQYAREDQHHDELEECVIVDHVKQVICFI